MCSSDLSGTGWYTVFGRAIAKTGNFFIVMTSAELVAGIGDAPYPIVTIIRFLFTVAAVFQGAVWAREIILGAIEHRTAASDYHGAAIRSRQATCSTISSRCFAAAAPPCAGGSLSRPAVRG